MYCLKQYKTNPAVLRDTITAAVTALAEGKIKPEEMPVPPRTDPKAIRYAPSFATVPPAERSSDEVPYTVDALAKFLGHADATGHATDNFRAMFGALELLSEGYLTEAAIKGMSPATHFPNLAAHSAHKFLTRRWEQCDPLASENVADAL